MSRIRRALRELLRSDIEAADKAMPDWYVWKQIADLHEPLDKIALSLAKIERRKRRPRIVMCEHPELHPEVEVG